MREPLLIINADDYGLTSGVCRGILAAQERGVVTSTSALVVGPAFAAHAGALRDSGLGVGLHVALVGEDAPLLEAREIPSLVDRRGRLARDWRSFVVRAARGAIDPDDVAREATAQADALEGVGITMTHLDSHQNLHLWPMVAHVLLDLAVEREVRATRLPRTRRWAGTGLGVRALSASLSRAAAARGIVVPDAAGGLDEAGTWTERSLVDAIDRLAEGSPVSAELATHPGLDPDPDRTRYRWGYGWSAEVDALTSPEARRAVERNGFRPGSFAELASERPRSPDDVRGAVMASYRTAGARARAHTRIRWATAPLAGVADVVPAEGRILDLGCGHGALALLMAQQAPGRRIHAVDVDPEKVAVARGAVREAGLDGRIQVDRVLPDWRPLPSSYDAVVVVDVLYLLGPEAALELVDDLVGAVRPGGRIVIKEMAATPRWKAAVNHLQEGLAVRVLGFTEGDGVAVVEVGVLGDRLARHGVVASIERVDQRRAHPHVLMVGDRSDGPEEDTG